MTGDRLLMNPESAGFDEQQAWMARRIELEDALMAACNESAAAKLKAHNALRALLEYIGMDPNEASPDPVYQQINVN